MAGDHDIQIRLYEPEDPFGIFDSLISITTEIHVINPDGDYKELYGIFGMHFDISLFEKTIDPLLENAASDYASNILYWVYSIKQTLNEGNTVTADSSIYENELASENTLSDSIFESLYADLIVTHVDREIRTFEMDSGDVYVGYAQRVPEAAETYEEIDFAIIFLVR